MKHKPNGMFLFRAYPRKLNGIGLSSLLRRHSWRRFEPRQTVARIQKRRDDSRHGRPDSLRHAGAGPVRNAGCPAGASHTSTRRLRMA